jgi:predicted aconitase
MQLTADERAILNGEQGETLAKVMKTMVLYGDVFGASHFVPVESEFGHIVTSFGISVMKPVYSLMDELIAGNAISSQKFTVDPRPMDFKNVPSNLLQNIAFKVMYSKQKVYEKQLQQMGLLGDDAFSCTCYMEEVGNIPEEGQVLSWAESSAVSYANSVLGARCNRNSGIIELFGSILGKVPYFGLLTPEGREATWEIDIQTNNLPEAQLLGSAIGLAVQEEVPYVKGLNRFLGDELTPEVRDYLKDFGAAAASNGSVGLYHVENLTPEAKKQGRGIIREGAKKLTIDDAYLQEIYDAYPDLWEKADAKPKLCFIGCPHLSLDQLHSWKEKIARQLRVAGKKKVDIPTVLCAAKPVLDVFEKRAAAKALKQMGVTFTSICPLMYMNNPLCSKMPVITSSNKLRTYTSAHYLKESELLARITGGK